MIKNQRVYMCIRAFAILCFSSDAITTIVNAKRVLPLLDFSVQVDKHHRRSFILTPSTKKLRIGSSGKVRVTCSSRRSVKMWIKAIKAAMKRAEKEATQIAASPRGVLKKDVLKKLPKGHRRMIVLTQHAVYSYHHESDVARKRADDVAYLAGASIVEHVKEMALADHHAGEVKGRRRSYSLSSGSGGVGGNHNALTFGVLPPASPALYFEAATAAEKERWVNELRHRAATASMKFQPDRIIGLSLQQLEARMEAMFVRAFEGDETAEPQKTLDILHAPLQYVLQFGGGTKLLFVIEPTDADDITYVNELLDGIDRGDELVFQDGSSPRVPAAVLFHWLKSLPTSLIPSSMYSTVLGTVRPDNVDDIVQLCSSLPQFNKIVLSRVMRLLAQLADFGVGYDDDAALLELCIKFRPIILRPDSGAFAKLDDDEFIVRLLWTLLTGAHKIFSSTDTAPLLVWETFEDVLGDEEEDEDDFDEFEYHDVQDTIDVRAAIASRSHKIDFSKAMGVFQIHDIDQTNTMASDQLGSALRAYGEASCSDDVADKIREATHRSKDDKFDFGDFVQLLELLHMRKFDDWLLAAPPPIRADPGEHQSRARKLSDGPPTLSSQGTDQAIVKQERRRSRSLSAGSSGAGVGGGGGGGGGTFHCLLRNFSAATPAVCRRSIACRSGNSEILCFLLQPFSSLSICST